MKKLFISDKFNIVLIILFFIIPLVTLNISFYFFFKINEDWAKKEQQTKAIHEVETLSSEADFGNEFTRLFGEFFNLLKDSEKINLNKPSFLTDYLKKSSEKIFKKPFPDYNLFVIKTIPNNNSSELLHYHGNLGVSKKALCFAFEYLYNLNISDKSKIKDFKNKEPFAKTLLGQFTNTEILAKEMRGLTAYTNGIHKNSWFIWDYFIGKNNEVYGVILLCNISEECREIGRLLALKRLKDRRYATGAFIPLLAAYGKPVIPSPLNKSKIFNNFIKNLTIQDVNNLEKWLINSLPQGISLGNYTAYCNLERGSTHIAVVLVKSVKNFSFPKWLIGTNIFLLLIMEIILFIGVSYGKWPKINLITRFTLSYILASFLPLALLGVAAHGYLIQYEMTTNDQAKSSLISTLKTFDIQKNTIVKEYREAFSKAINDKKIISLLKRNNNKNFLIGNLKKHINNILIIKRVIEIFEKEPQTPLPLLGVKIINQNGEGQSLIGSALKEFDFKTLVNSFLSIQVDILRKKIQSNSNNSGSKIYESYKRNDKNDLANKGYRAILGRDLDGDMTKRLSEPILRKNGNFSSYQIFDVLKKNGNPIYMLFVAWDDETLDNKLITNAINNYSLKNLNHNFMALKIKGQELEYVGEKSRHASQSLIESIKKRSKLVALTQKTDTFTENGNIIVIMPSLNFNQTIFVGWLNKNDILLDLFNRKIVLFILVILSFIILWICIVHSASIFLKPISALKNALDEVTLGNLNIGFNNVTNDELGNLSKEFSKMIEKLVEKERLTKLISDQAIQALKRNTNGVLSDTETFKGVALVSDIRNFTGMSEKYDPVIITQLLNEHFAEMTKIISEKGGLIYKFIGDAIEAVFPENSEFKKSASERAFEAAYLMFDKLSIINNKRKTNNLFNYKIGVGLCYGTMFSGTVGSIESRLDYSILGDPLKNAAKYEALSIQNPDFPIVVSQEIAEKLALLGIQLKKLDNNRQNSSVYSLDKDNYENNNYLLNIKKISKEKKESVKIIEERKVFSLFNGIQNKNYYKKLCFNILTLFTIALLISSGVGFIFSSNYKRLKYESNKECSRLSEQLQSNEVMKSCFNILCFEFYDDIDRSLNSENNIDSFKQKILKIADKYEKIGCPIPKYWCCLYNGLNLNKEGIISKGFSDKTCKDIATFAISLVTETDGKKIKDKNIKNLMGSSVGFFDIKSSHFRRSSIATIQNEDILIDTNKIFDKNHNNIISYIFCGMPKTIVESSLPSYYTLLAGNSIQLAIKDKDNWYFSKGFYEKDKNILIKSPESSYLTNKGYYIENIDINNKKYTIYAITNKLSSEFLPIPKICCLTFFLILLLGSLIIFILEKILFLKTSLSIKLNKDILLSALLPILIVCFVSYLYINEDYIVKNSEIRFKLNNLIDDIESREFYYHPLYEKYLDNFSSSNIIRKYINFANNSIKPQEKNKYVNILKNYLKNQIVNYGYKSFNTDFITNNKNIDENNPSKIKINPFCRITEMLIIGKNDWVVSLNYRSSQKEFNEKLTNLGKILQPLFSEIYFNKEEINDLSSTKNEMIIDELLNAFNTIFGKEFVFKLISFPNNLISVIISYSTASIYVSTVKSNDNPQNIEAIIISLIYHDNEFKPSICKMRNNKEPFKPFLYSGSMTNYLYCFYSSNINIGEFFFYYNDKENDDNNFPSKFEDFKAVKEFCFISSFINSSYVPVSTTINLYGNKLIEARQGNKIKDNVYIALASENPLKKGRLDFIIFILILILISIFIIIFISQAVIYDLLLPIKRLLEGAIFAAQGKYNYRTNFIRGDELGILCFSFDKMMKSLEEKQLMNRMVSKTALMGASNLTDIDSKKVEVALIYVTVPGFDKIMKSMPPLELFSKLRNQIATISKIVMENDGDIDKIMGEKLLIAFHLGNKSPTEIAIKASKVASLIETCNKLSFKVSVGVNYGQVISGYLGVGEKRDFTIIGDPVNVTARIAVFAEKIEFNSCIISEQIKQLISNNFKLEEYGEVLFKGKSLPSKVYRII